MRILCVCQALDLGIEDIGVTPAWWQLLKGLHQVGVDVFAVPYFGREIHSLWWRTLANPNGTKSRIYQAFEPLATKLLGHSEKTEFRRKHSDLLKKLARTFATPKWKKFFERVVKEYPDLSAVVTFNVPLNHFGGIPKLLREEHGIPLIAYDGDLPTSLPRFGGISSSPYVDAELQEFDALVTNSKGSAAELLELGARRVFTLYYGADPEVFCPMKEIRQDIDVAFYGVGSSFRENAMKYMIGEPSSILAHRKFLLSGPRLPPKLGKAMRATVPYRELSCRSMVNLNIVREPHAKTYASSSSRPFELAAMGSCIVSNEYLGLEEWFETGKEVFVAENAKSAIELYEWLINHESVRAKVGQAARDRVIKEHSYSHRARELLQIIKTIQ